jgi:anti-sigma-K factor RskA
MKPWQTLIVAVSAVAALAVGLGAQAGPLEHNATLLAFLHSVHPS